MHTTQTNFTPLILHSTAKNLSKILQPDLYEDVNKNLKDPEQGL